MTQILLCELSTYDTATQLRSCCFKMHVLRLSNKLHSCVASWLLRYILFSTVPHIPCAEMRYLTRGYDGMLSCTSAVCTGTEARQEESQRSVIKN